jgi:hypothetical protein
MVEQRVIIDHLLYHIQLHPEGHLDKREEYILKPIEVDGVYLCQIPSTSHVTAVKKDSEIKLVYFTRKSK